ncbi:hypothetical protein FRC14_006003 [Serendipita sp. 396]|nr:hypothetical protein FRC14_006003 [Serendipita sp. 396]KAG8779722.1 hypothetical protein FRC15_009984 [Serendipita sp. 397]KAG8795844.1 hypothetical protein FRC16_009940 [Serendipita sp. 398]KAG8864398.1 hypothetical protein FRC20_010255 [Serendipita sp. 405]KAG9052385.1 hypothetical protein FS842_009947 [Serendipita sp. 407]
MRLSPVSIPVLLLAITSLAVAAPVPNPDGAVVGTGPTVVSHGTHSVPIGGSNAAPSSLRIHESSEEHLDKRGFLGSILGHAAEKGVEGATHHSKGGEIAGHVLGFLGKFLPFR